MSKISENEDDPEVYESSGDEWDKEDEKSSNRRSSQRLSKKPRRTVVEPDSSSEEEDSETEDTDSEEEPRKRKSKNGVTNKPKEEKNENEDSSEENKANNSDSNSGDSESKTEKGGSAGRGIHRKFIPKTIFSEDYATGSFVILKKDAQVGDPAKHPSIWRIDGKALLQKYEAFDEEEKVRHKNTSIYTGWSPMDRDLYAPVTVDVVHHNNQNLTVELHWDKLKEVVIDSD